MCIRDRYKSETISEYRDNIGNIERVKNEETNELLLSVIEKTQKDGYFTFGEMLLYCLLYTSRCV